MKLELFLTISIFILNSKSTVGELLKDEKASSTPCKVPSSYDCKHKTLCEKKPKSPKCVAFKKANSQKGKNIKALTKKAKGLRKQLRKLRKELKALKKAIKKSKGKSTKAQKKRRKDLKKLIQQTRTQLLETMAARRVLNIGPKKVKKLPKSQSKLLKLRAKLIKKMNTLDKLEKQLVKAPKKDKKKSSSRVKKLKKCIKKLKKQIKKLEKKVLKASTENNVDIARLKRILAETKADTKRYTTSKDKTKAVEYKKRAAFNLDFQKKLQKYIKNIETKRSILKKKKLTIKD